MLNQTHTVYRLVLRDASMKRVFRIKKIVMGALFCVATATTAVAFLFSRPTCGEVECFLTDQLRGYQKEDVYQNTDRSYGALFKKGTNQMRVEA